MVGLGGMSLCVRAMSDDEIGLMMLGALLAGSVLLFRLGCRWVDRDFNRSRRRALSVAAEDGRAEALYMLAQDMMGSGSPSAAEAQRAVELYRRAADAGHGAAMDALAECYMQGNGVEQDSARAICLWQQSLAAGYHEARLALAECYLEGMGVPQDAARAVALYRQSAREDVPHAFYMLARCYLLGRGVPESRRSALKWLRRAALYRHPEAEILLDELEGDS